MAFQRPLCRQIQPRFRGNRFESLELHALFRPDGDPKKRTPLLRTSTNTNKKGRGTGGNGGIKITTGGGNKQIQSTSSSSVDKMRLDLMRSDLSIKIAEDRVKRLESELKEMTKKYNWAQSALRDRASTGGDRKQLTSLKGKDKSPLVQPQKKKKSPSHVQLKTKAIKGKKLVQNGLHTTIIQKADGNIKKSPANSARPTSLPTFQGNTINDLPPFAAGLFANAEREEKRRRLKLGLIEEADLDDLSSTSVAPSRASTISPFSHSSSTSPSSIEALPPMAAGLFEQAERIEMERRAKMGFIEKSELSLSLLPDDGDDCDHNEIAMKDIPVVASIANRSITIDKTADLEEEVEVIEITANSSIVDSNFTTAVDKKLNSPSFGNTTAVEGKSMEIKTKRSIIVNAAAPREGISVNDDAEKELLSLRKQCAILSHKLSRSEELRRAQTDELKTSLKSEKILRGLNSDWTRRMSDARKEMDEEKADWNKDYEEKKKCWEEEKNMLEERLNALECEREELQLRLHSQSNITFVANLFCDLLKERVTSKLSQTRHRLFPGHTNVSLAQNETQTFVFSSPNLTWRRLRYGKKVPNRMLTIGGATEQRRASRALRLFSWVRAINGKNGVRNPSNSQNDTQDEEDGNSPPSTISPPPGLEPIAPLLVTKKRRIPKLYSEKKKSAWKSPSLVPKFLR
eukprot:scaffold575_cov121-Skeletonema_menzelii.AAC.4